MFKFNPLSGKFEIDTGFAPDQIVVATVDATSTLAGNQFQRGELSPLFEIICDQDGNVIIWE